jgi:hypothetical protein
MLKNIFRISRIELGLCLILAVITFSMYVQILDFDFVNYDDNDYVYDNPHVQKGVTLHAITWAFTTGHASNWHPLTWIISYRQFLIIIFFVSRNDRQSLAKRICGRRVRSPSTAYSVCRLGFRAQGCLKHIFLDDHALGVRHPGWATYAWVLIFFILGLMSKPMVVTLPFVLLILDFWPLARLRIQGAEKQLNLVIAGLIRENTQLFIHGTSDVHTTR